MYYDFFYSKGIVLFKNAAAAALLISLSAVIASGIMETIVYEWF